MPDFEPGIKSSPYVTVNSLLNHPEFVQRRIAELTEQRCVAEALFPPHYFPRRQRVIRRIRGRLFEIRERLALKIAPWLQ